MAEVDLLECNIKTTKDKNLLSARRFCFIVAVLLLVSLALFKPEPYWRILKFIPDGILITLEVTVCSIALALIFGFIAGLGRTSKVRIINSIASIYIEVVRGIPLLVQLFYIYYSLGTILKVPDFVAAVTGMGFCYGAYLAEVIRAGIQSIPKGQTEAAHSLGMTHFQTMRHIIIPQALRLILPPVGNEFIALLKDSSLVSILAVADLTRRGREFSSETFMYFETYTMIALVYLLMTLFFSKLVSLMEARLKGGSR